MFQSFDVLSSPSQARGRVQALRAKFDEWGVDAVAVPRSDEFLGEYVPACAERLAWLTGFTGSAGLVLVMRDSAHVFTDGRYTAQVAAQTDRAIFTLQDLVSRPLPMFVTEGVPNSLALGVDPWCWPGVEIDRLEKALEAKGGRLVLLPENPVDAVWTDRPAAPLGAVAIQPDTYAGELATDKLVRMREAVTSAGADAVVVADPSSVAWIFNIRGEDLPSTPHPLSRAIIPASGYPVLFIDERKTGREAEAYLTQLADLEPPSHFDDALRALGSHAAKVLVDPAVTPFAVTRILKEAGAAVIDAPDPARLPRAVKNAAEIAASQLAHRVDGVAMVRFLHWLSLQEPDGLDEISVATRLEAFRAETGTFHQMPLKALSFDTISGAGPNAAIIHYRVNTQTNRRLARGEMILVDSGGQYRAGTTDITRTVGLGPVPDEQKRFFTLVLQGMIAISMLRFPTGTRGVDIDAFARIALWKAGADYGHGTGHGVGSFLSVHEGPQSISRRGMVVLEPGMILSNEPGYYRDGAFGIRIENLVSVHEPRPIEGGDRPMLGFETLTLCPIDRALIVPGLLSSEERGWLDAYHARVREDLMPLLSGDAAAGWLEDATAPL